MLLAFFRPEYCTTQQLSCSYPSLTVYSRIWCAFKNNCSYSLKSDVKAILPVPGSLEKGSLLLHPVCCVSSPWQPTTGHPRKQMNFSSPSCRSRGNTEFSPLQRSTATRTKDHFHPKGHITDPFSYFSKAISLFFSSLWAGSKLQAHALGHLSCGQGSLLMAAKS